MFTQRKYNTATTTSTHIRIPMIKRGAVDFALGADWTPAAGDVTVKKDGGAAANIATLPTAVVVGNSAAWEFPLSAAELTCKQLVVTICDAAPKAVEDNMFILETFGDPAAMTPIDLSDGVRMGITSLPNASPAAAGGLPTVDASNHVAGISGAKNTLDALNDLSETQVENAVLDADVASHHVTPGSAGQRIEAAGTVSDPWSAALPGGYGAGTAGAIVGNGIDVAVSSRLASAAYVSPDNAGITAVVSATSAINAKTANLPANPAATGDAMTLDLSQSVPTSNAPQSVGDALNAARVNAFGNWVLLGNTYTLYAPDGVTPVHSFTLDNINNPTSRT